MTAPRPRPTIAVAAGKGGTGKTLLSTSLALSVAECEPVQLLDCDVEEPNAGLLFEHEVIESTSVTILVPCVDLEACTRCGVCAETCQFGAIAVIRGAVATFPNLCAGCGSCAYACPESAIAEEDRLVGAVEQSSTEVNIELITGRVRVGELRSGPVTKDVKRLIRDDVVTVIDAPPGTACPMQETVEDSDFCILVTEPTPFGLSDLRAAVDTCRALDVPIGVVVNRAGVGDTDIDGYCREAGVPLLLNIPHERAIAEAYSRGEALVAARPEWRGPLRDLYKTVTELISGDRKELSAHAGI